MTRKRNANSRIAVHLKNSIIPIILTALTVSILVLLLEYLNFDLHYGNGSSVIIFASFGVSAYLLFMLPRSRVSKIRGFVKSYIFAIIAGILGFYMLGFLPIYVVAGIVVFLVSVMISIGNALHPPAVGISLAFVFFSIGVDGIAVVLLGMLILLFLRLVLERFIYTVEKDIEWNTRRR
jgi:CBS-domain-containing membrane protein